MIPPAVDLSHTPGIYYALAYWLSCTFYILLCPRKQRGWRLWAVHLAFLAAVSTFMTVTDGIGQEWFFLCMAVDVALILLDIKLCTGMDWIHSGYFCARAFILGELAAALEWQLFYFGLTVLGLPLRMYVNILFLTAVHGGVFGAACLLEWKYRAQYGDLRLTSRETATAALMAAATFGMSNVSFAFQNTPFSGQSPAEIFIIRTLVDLAGAIMLYAYHVRLREMSAEREMERLQAQLHMQYETYRMSEESIALVNRKYHDLKHQIALLRSEAGPEGAEYLDRMEAEIRTYEAQNKTGNRVLDTILTAKSVQCQAQGIELTCVADGAALGFMDPMDLSALFGNALDNAIESVQKLPEPEKRLIHISVSRQKGFLRIRVENCFEGELSYRDGIPVTTKRDARFHGYGLKSIQSTAEKYGGSMTIGVKNGWFELRLLFPLPQTAEGGQ